MGSAHVKGEQQYTQHFLFLRGKSTGNALNGKIRTCQCERGVKKHEGRQQNHERKVKTSQSCYFLKQQLNRGGKTVLFFLISLVEFGSLNYVLCEEKKKYRVPIKFRFFAAHSFQKPEASLRDRRTLLEDAKEGNIFC